MISLLAATALLIPAHSLPPCEYEDGSSQRICIWNAQTQGNTQGRSLLIIRGGTDRAKVIRISHRDARLLTR